MDVGFGDRMAVPERLLDRDDKLLKVCSTRCIYSSIDSGIRLIEKEVASVTILCYGWAF
jgi:hypothetical protein